MSEAKHTPEKIDEYLETILNASGSSLRHFMPSTKMSLRKAMADVIAKALSEP